MERLSVFTIFILLTINLASQTFSLIIDPVEGDETTFHNNSVVDMAITQDAIILSGQHSCFPAAGSSNNIFCASLSSFDFEGNLNNAILIDTFFDAQSGGLLVNEGRIFTANFKHKEPFSGRDLYIQEYNQNLELVKQNIIPTQSNGAPNNDGIKFINGNYYAYGDILNGPNDINGYIQKLDADFNLIWDKQFAHTNLNGCDKLQETNDGDLMYIHEYADEATGPESNDGLQIVKLNSDGVKLDSLEIEDEGTYGKALLSDETGIVYTYTYFHPTDESIYEQSAGRINKYNSNLDSLLWSLKFPFNNYIDFRMYFISELVLAKNGDILACGSVFDEGPDGPIATQNNHTHNAFICRVSEDGEIKWMHLYKSPNINKLLPVAEFGDFHTSALGSIIELDDGRIIASGTSRLSPSQGSAAIGTNNPWAHFMILAVDGETGCISGEECDEIIILDGQNRPRDNFLPVINANYLWIESLVDDNILVEESIYTYSEDSVFQNTNHYHEKIINPNENSLAPEVVGYFREIGGRIYQKFEGNFNERIIFDMHLETGESIIVERENGPVELVAIATDTVKFQDEVPRKRIFLECASIQAEQEPIIWIEGIGELNSRGVCGTEDQQSQIICVQDLLGNPIYSLNENTCEDLSSICPLDSFCIGDKWTYDEHIYYEISFKEFEIVREEEWMGEEALVVRPGLWDQEDYMVQKDGKIYFWDRAIEEYQLNYDFNNDSLYYIRYYNVGSNEIDSAAVFVDSIRTFHFNDQEMQVQYCRSDYGYGPTQFTIEVIKNIGYSSFGPRIPLNIFIDNFAGGTGNIRCFESTDCNIQFVDYPCDTIFNPTSTKELLDVSDFDLFPNPVQDKLYLQTDDQNLNYQIYNLQGQLLKEGIYDHNIEVQSLPTGIHFLRLYKEGQFYKAIKFVKR